MMSVRRVVCVLVVLALYTPAMGSDYLISFGLSGSPISDYYASPGEEITLQLLVSDDDPNNTATFTSVDLKLGNSDPALLPLTVDPNGMGLFAGFTTLTQGDTLISAFSPSPMSDVGHIRVADVYVTAPIPIGDYLFTGGQHPTNIGYDLDTFWWQDGDVAVSDLTIHVPEPTTIGLLVVGGVVLVGRRR